MSLNYKALQAGILGKGVSKDHQVFLLLVFRLQGITIKNFPNISSSWKSTVNI